MFVLCIYGKNKICLNKWWLSITLFIQTYSEVCGHSEKKMASNILLVVLLSLVLSVKYIACSFEFLGSFSIF